MRKKMIVLASAVVITIGVAATALAAPPVRYGGCCGSVKVCYSLMLDQNGNILDKSSFEANLNKAIENNRVSESDREYFVDMYDYCSANSGGCFRGGFGRGTEKVN